MPLDIRNVPTEERLLWLEAEAMDALPCDWAHVLRFRDPVTGGYRLGEECARPSLYIISWLRVCGHGHDLPGDQSTLLCRPHMLELHGANGMYCAGCQCPLAGDPYHVIKSIVPVKP